MDLTIESKSGNILEYKGKALQYDKKFYDDIYYPALKDTGVKEKYYILADTPLPQ